MTLHFCIKSTIKIFVVVVVVSFNTFSGRAFSSSEFLNSIFTAMFLAWKDAIKEAEMNFVFVLINKKIHQ